MNANVRTTMRSSCPSASSLVTHETLKLHHTDPDGPRMAVNRLTATATETSSSAVDAAPPIRYRLLIPTARAASTAPGVVDSHGHDRLYAMAVKEALLRCQVA